MFDAIGVSGRTRKPWTVVISFVGQIALIGLAILIPLIGTDVLPHRLSWVSVPAPPRALHRRTVQEHAKQASMITVQFTRKGLVLPGRIPPKAVVIEDPEFTAGGDIGVMGGMEGANGPGNGAINTLVGSSAVAPPPPPPPVEKKAPQPAPLKRIRVSEGVQQGKLTSGPRPVYPVLARQARIEGTVRLEAVISREGTILNLRAVSGHPLLIPAALAAVQQWVFQPTSLNGDPVEVATEIEVHFTLQK